MTKIGMRMIRDTLDMLVEQALARVLAQHLKDPNNNPVNTAVFGSDMFISTLGLIEGQGQQQAEFAQVLNFLLEIVKSQTKKINDLADALDILLSRLEAQQKETQLDLDIGISTGMTDFTKKPSKPN